MSDISELADAATELLAALRSRETPYVATARNSRPTHEVSAAKAARVTRARERLRQALADLEGSTE